MSLQQIDAFIEAQMAEQHMPGLAVAIVRQGALVWSRGYGYADIASQTAMDPDKTVQNIGSVSKTITATAIMQLQERKLLDIDTDINDYLPFPVRNPAFPDTPITTRHLLIHRSSIKDGAGYEAIYELGDPSLTLEAWIKAYFTPDGQYFDAASNWHSWEPGTSAEIPLRPRNYSNVAYGLLGYLVERTSGQSFIDYCEQHIFAPLGMDRSSWLLADTDVEAHATLYVIDDEDEDEQEEIEQYTEMGFIRPKIPHPITNHPLHPLNLYSFANYPDGLLRTSANQLARFLASMMNFGRIGDAQLLHPLSVAAMFSVQNDSDPRQGLCWNTATRTSTGDVFWWHDGGDPGTSTLMFGRPFDQLGVIVFVNASEVNAVPILMHLFDNADQLLTLQINPS